MKRIWLLLLVCGSLCAQSQITVTCSGYPQQCDGSTLTPESTTLDFGYVSDGSTVSVTFTITNGSQSAVSVSLQRSEVLSDAFSSDSSAPIPATIAAGASTTFAIDFSPTQAGLARATLVVGSSASNSFALAGTGVDSTPGGASPLKFQVCGENCSPATPLYSPWTFPATPVGSEDYLFLRPINPTSSKIRLITFTLTDTQNFSLTNEYVDEVIAPYGTGTPFYVNITPQQTGALSSILRALYCIPDASGACQDTTPQIEPVVQLQGSGTVPEVTLSCSGAFQACNSSPLRPTSVLDFGNVNDNSTASATFTLANNSQDAVNVSLQTPASGSSPFSAGPSTALPATVAAGATLTFKLNFSPAANGLSQATILVNGYPTNGTHALIGSFPLQGTGGATDLSSLLVSYTDATGVPQLVQNGKIDFGQIAAGAQTTLNVSVCNPQKTTNAVTIPVPAISGSGFTASSLPSAPVTLQPAAAPPYCAAGPGTASFQLTAAGSAAGTQSGALSIGSLQLALTAQIAPPPLPSMSFQLSGQPLASRQQMNLTIQLASPSPIPATGTLSMTFAPSIQNVSDDPAIVFLANSSRQLNVSVASGSQTAAYNGQSALAFQTGTTAGTITFTLQFPGAAPLTQSFTIPPDKVQIASATATVSSPDLVITMDGYDNTYSAGQLSFTFYDTKGNAIPPGAITVDATSQFHQYFFNNNQAGGAFSLQARFPVSGDGAASEVGSVSVTLNNSAGLVTTTQTFQ